MKFFPSISPAVVVPRGWALPLFSAVFLSLLVGCGGDPPPPTGTPVGELTVSADRELAKANGLDAIQITVAGSTQGPITLTTDRGSFAPAGDGAALVKSTTMPADGSVTLHSCNGFDDAACIGRSTIRAIDAANAAGLVDVQFVLGEQCSNGEDDNGNGNVDCEDVEDCPAGSPCGGDDDPPGLVCDAKKACAACAPEGVPAEGKELSCGDGGDNDCDGKSDCEDDDCDGAKCDAPSGGVGSCAGGKCACPGGAEVCDDGIDNDCDGKTDCEDADCDAAVCATPGGGVGSCAGGKCACEPTPEACDDGVDNDCNDLVDCKDPQCVDQICDAKLGLTCGSATTCSTCPGGAKSESDCTDGQDDDCDGLVDCADPDCEATICGDNGLQCNASGKCECESAIATEASCGDGQDDDCDGLVDCADPECRSNTVNQFAKSCDTAGTFGRKCDWLGQCVCPGGGSLETNCSDGKDDDCDGMIDCVDPDCQPGGASSGATCDATGRVCDAVPNGAGKYCTVCPTGQVSETSCTGNQDDDCDGKIDCADTDCAGLACGTSPTQVCQEGQCVDTANAYSLTISLQRSAIPADGLSTSVVTATLKNTQGSSVANQPLAFAITGPGAWLENGSALVTSNTNAGGAASATFRSSADGGVATITVTLQGTGVGSTTQISMPIVATIKPFSTQSLLMGVRSSGFQEQNQVVFQVVDPQNAPYPAGLLVTFSHSPLGGSTVGPPPVPSCVQPCVVTTTGVTDAQGKVTVTLYSGTVAGTVNVSAAAEAGGQSASGTSPVIAIVGAKASGSHITLVCSANVPGLVDTDCTTSLVETTFSCEVAMADRFNNVLGVATLATFASEAGLVGQPSSTPQYNPANPQTAGLGVAKNVIATKGGAIPIDVAPIEAETYSLVYDDGKCGSKLHNPRDGVAAVIVMTKGEEGYTDLNGDGTYNGPGGDPGGPEPFIDLGEPFVDQDDSGAQNGNEFFLDLNSNGVWDGPNALWDSNTTLWAETRVVYTDAAMIEFEALTGDHLFSRFYGSSPPAPGGSVDFSLKPSQSVSVNLFATDLNFNAIAPSTAWSVSKTFGNVTVQFVDKPINERPQGFFFKQEFCDATDATACGPTCPPKPGVVQCLRKSSLNSFEYGSYGVVTVTGGTPEGSAQIRATGVTHNKSSHIYMSGESVKP